MARGNHRKQHRPLELGRLIKKVKFYLRPSRSGSASFIECNVSHDNARVRFGIVPDGADPKDYVLSEDAWDRKQGRASGLNARNVNARVQEILTQAETFFSASLDGGLPIDLEKLKAVVTGKAGAGDTVGGLLDLVRRFMKEYTFHDENGNKVGHKRNTTATYKTLLVRLTDFEVRRSAHLLAIRPLRVDEFVAVNERRSREGEPKVIPEFKRYLTEERGYNPNSLSKALKCLATILRWIQEKGYAGRRTLYTSTTSVRFKSKKEALRKEELEAVTNLELVEGSVLWHVRNVFVLAANTGLRYSDWHKLDPNRHALRYQEIVMEKTGGTVQVLHTQTVRNILKLYEGKGWPAIVMPSASGVYTKNAKMNLKLKEVCRRAGLDRSCYIRVGDRIETKPLYELVSTHTARRTFTTSMLLGEGHSPQLVARLTGHKDLDMLRPDGPYFKDDPERLADLIGIEHGDS